MPVVTTKVAGVKEIIAYAANGIAEGVLRVTGQRVCPAYGFRVLHAFKTGQLGATNCGMISNSSDSGVTTPCKIHAQVRANSSTKARFCSF
jgi:hypothetical protein